MGEFEDFATVGDIAELEHVCYLLKEAATEGSCSLHGLTGASSRLVQRLGRQDERSREIVEAAHPGLYARTWIAEVFQRLYFSLDSVSDKPCLLAEKLPGIELDLHKVLIAAHVIFDDAKRALLIDAAIEAGKATGAAEANKARSDQARNAVMARDDQKDRRAFVAWLSPHVEAGKSARNVAELKTWAGYSVGEWCDYSDAVIKGWAKSAGHPEFRTGRPRKSTRQRVKG